MSAKFPRGGGGAGPFLARSLPIHHQGLRLALGAFRTSPSASHYFEANEPSLNTSREKLPCNMLLELLKIIQIQLMM